MARGLQTRGCGIWERKSMEKKGLSSFLMGLGCLAFAGAEEFSCCYGMLPEQGHGCEFPEKGIAEAFRFARARVLG